MPPKRLRAERAEARDEVREAHQEPQVPPPPPPPPPPELISTTQVAVIVAQAVETAMRAMAAHFPQPQAPPPVAPAVQGPVGPPSWQRVRETFQKGHPPEFRGSTDVVEACDWKKNIQRHLRILECTDVQKQMFATFRLSGAALQWWESVTTAEE